MADLSNITTLGTKTKTIPVTISLHIIQHFSAGLYTSPNKAFEELVVNSYDAGADKVQVLFPFNIESPEAFICVVDNGSSMDLNGFVDLWSIGKSKKRTGKATSSANEDERLAIGKFGIGKLSTYVLARELTYVTKVKNEYYAITMDFGLLESAPDMQNLTLEARRLTQDEARLAVEPLFNDFKPVFNLFGKEAVNTWTVVVLRQMKNLAYKIKTGRLKWVLRTALPLSPRFKLFFRDELLESPKLEHEKILKWAIGQKDEVAKKCNFPSIEMQIGENKLPTVHIDGLGPVWGVYELYKDPLPGGKAEEMGRSNGFFVMVRDRLINEHDELFGIEQLSHGSFSRFRMIIHANALDTELRATRESVNEENEGVKNLRMYMKACFNHVRTFYNNWLENEPVNQSLSSRLSRSARGLSREPLLRAIRAYISDPTNSLYLTRVPTDLNKDALEKFIAELEQNFKSEDFFNAVEFDDSLSIEDGLAVFDAKTRSFRININHPFYANYSIHYRNPEPFKIIAITEVLSEPYLLDEGLSSTQVREFLQRRDRFLRELVLSTRLSAPLVAQMLDDNKSDEKGLENALHEGFKSLGFEVTPMAKKGEPDGMALARLGFRVENNSNETYKVIYDSKSSLKNRIKAHTVGTGTIDLHKFKNGADFAIVIAQGFEGGDDPSSNISLQTSRQGITCLELNDFILLILLSSIRPVGMVRLKNEFFSKCHTPAECKEWIKKVVNEPEKDNPIADILTVIWNQQSMSPEPPTAQSIRTELAILDPKKYKGFKSIEVKEWMKSVVTIVGTGVTLDGEKINIDCAPNIILARIEGQKNKLPQAFMKQFEKMREKK